MQNNALHAHGKPRPAVWCIALAASCLIPENAAAQTTSPFSIIYTFQPETPQADGLVPSANLTPGYVGLYQINAAVPTGLNHGNQQVIINVNGTLAAV